MAEASAKIAKILAVTGLPTLIVRHNVGRVRIIPGSTDHVAIEAVKSAVAGGEAEAQRALETLEVKIDQTGNTVRVESKYHHIRDLFFIGQRRIDLVITAPPQANLNLNLNAGNAELEGIAGTIEVDLNAGSMALRQVGFMGASRVRANAASITGLVSIAAGTVLEIDLNSGSLELALPADTPAHLEASANAGAISFDGWNVAVRQRIVQAVASGDLNPSPTATITARINAGRLSLTRQTPATGASAEPPPPSATPSPADVPPENDIEPGDDAPQMI